MCATSDLVALLSDAATAARMSASSVESAGGAAEERGGGGAAVVRDAESPFAARRRERRRERRKRRRERPTLIHSPSASSPETAPVAAGLRAPKGAASRWRDERTRKRPHQRKCARLKTQRLLPRRSDARHARRARAGGARWTRRVPGTAPRARRRWEGLGGWLWTP